MPLPSCSLALDYGKRDNVFELRLASGRTLLMQAE